MKRINLMLAVLTLLPASQVRKQEHTNAIAAIESVVAQAVNDAVGMGRTSAVVYLPDVMNRDDRQKAVADVKDKGYKVSEGSGVNEIIVQW